MQFMVKSYRIEVEGDPVRFFNLKLQSTGAIYDPDRDKVIDAFHKGEPVNLVLTIEPKQKGPGKP